MAQAKEAKQVTPYDPEIAQLKKANLLIERPYLKRLYVLREGYLAGYEAGIGKGKDVGWHEAIEDAKENPQLYGLAHPSLGCVRAQERKAV